MNFGSHEVAGTPDYLAALTNFNSRAREIAALVECIELVDHVIISSWSLITFHYKLLTGTTQERSVPLTESGFALGLVMNQHAELCIDRMCDAAERLWKAGMAPDLEAVVAIAAPDLKSQLARRLIELDREYRQKLGLPVPATDHYAEKFGVSWESLIDHPSKSFAETAVAEDSETPGLKLASVAPAMAADGSKDQSVEAEVLPTDGSRTTSAEPRVSQNPPEPCPAAASHSTATARTAPADLPAIPGYEVLSVLGRGGMGVVYKARQLTPDRVVAIKTVHSGLLAGWEQIVRFQAEAAAAGRLDHPGIVPIFEAGEVNGVHYFSMGYIDGTTLDYVLRDRVLPVHEAARICRDVAIALQYAHERGVIHRDIKPHNILMDGSHRPRITDFGLAKLTTTAADLTETGQIMGTTKYMSPEQAGGRTAYAGVTADVYSLGATLYRCITGRAPFQAASEVEVLRQVIEDEPVSPRRLNGEVSRDLETVCLKCLEKNPEQRFQSAGALAEELTRCLNGEPIQSRPVGPLEFAWRKCRRHPALTTSLALFALLILAAAVGLPYVLWQRSRLETVETSRKLDAVLLEQRTSEARQAQELARVKEFHAGLRDVRELRYRREPGWTWTAAGRLRELGTLRTADEELLELRTLLAESLLSPDMKEITRLNRDRAVDEIAISADGRTLAVSDFLGVPCKANIYRISYERDVATGFPVPHLQLIKTCELPSLKQRFQSLLGSIGLAKRQRWTENIDSLCLNHNGSKLAAVSRYHHMAFWDINDKSPTPYAVSELDGEEAPRSTRLNFSTDSSLLYAFWQAGFGSFDGVYHTFDTSDGRVLLERSGGLGDMCQAAGGTLLLSANDVWYRFNNKDSDLTTAENRSGEFWYLNAAVDRPVLMLLSRDDLCCCDAATRAAGMQLEPPDQNDENCQGHFLADTALAVRRTDDTPSLRLRDALSGRRVFDYQLPNNHGPLFRVNPDMNQVHLTWENSVVTLQVRGTAPLRAVSEVDVPVAETAGVTSDGEPATLSTATATYTGPQSAFAPGAHPIADCDLSVDGRRLAMLETSTEQVGRRSLLRVMDTADGSELHRWTCCELTDDDPSQIQGDFVTFAGDDRLVMTSSVPGNILVCSSDGFAVPDGIGIDPIVVPPSSTGRNRVVWELPQIPKIDQRRWRVGVAMQIPNAIVSPENAIGLSVKVGDAVHQMKVAETIVDAAAWYLFLPQVVSTDEFDAGLSITAELSAADGPNFEFSNGTGTVTENEHRIRVGSMYLFPADPPEGKNRYRLLHLTGRDDGGFALGVEHRVFQWTTDLTRPVGAPWFDGLNHEANLDTLSHSKAGVVVGSYSGRRILLDGDNKAVPIAQERLHFSRSRAFDGLSASAVAKDSLTAVTGDRGGQVQLFDLKQPANSVLQEFQAHDFQVHSLAVSVDADLIVTSDLNGLIRVWQRRSKEYDLSFELDLSDLPVVHLELSPDNRFLYVLREGERGVRRIDLSMLNTEFRHAGISFGD